MNKGKKAGEMHCFHQPVGKQYAYGKGPEYDSEEVRLQKKQQIDILKLQRTEAEVVGQAFVELVAELRETLSIQLI